MSQGQNKDLKFRFSVDDASAQKVKNIIREITSEATKLVEVMNRGGGGFGGLFSGASSRVGGPGTSSSAGAQSMGGGAGGGGAAGMANGLTKVLVDNKNLLKGIASESKDVMRVMQDALRDSFSKQAGDVAKLRAEIKLLSKEYKDLSGARSLLDSDGNPISGPMAAGQRSAIQAQMTGKMVELDKAQKTLDQLEVQMGGGKGKGFFAQLFSGGKIDMSKLAGPAAIGYMGYRAANAIADQMIAAPGQFNQQAVPMGQTFGGRALQMYRGQGGLAYLHALQDVVKGEQNEKANARSELDRILLPEARRRALDAVNRHGAAYRNDPAYVKRITRAYEQQARDKFAESHPDNDVLGDTASTAGWRAFKAIAGNITNPLAMGDALRSVDTQTKIEIDKRIQEQLDKSPLRYQAENVFESTSASMAGVMRSLGYSSRGKNGAYNVGVRNLGASLHARGLDYGDLTSAQGQIVSSGGFATAQALRGLVMNANIGHVGGLGNLIGAGAQFGYGNKALGGLGGMLAGTGLDPQAQSVLASTIAQSMLNGQYANDPAALLQAMSGFAGRGSSAGEQMRIMGGMSGGLGAMNGNLFGGGIDNLQRARNYVNAIGVTGGNNLFGSNYLAEHFSAGMLAQAQAGGGVNPALAARGITPDQVMAYGKRTFSSMFRNIALGGTGTPMGKLASDMLSGGFGSDIGGFIKSKGFKGKALTDVLQQFGAILETEGFAQGQSGEGMARIMAGLASPGSGKAGHFRDAYSGTKEELSEKYKAEYEKLVNQGISQIDAKAIAARNVAAGQMGDIGENLGLNAEAAALKLKRLSDTIDAVDTHLRTQYGIKGRPAAAAPAQK